MIIRPILYSTTMVQAVLDNLKNQTRRTKGLENINKNPDCWVFINTSTDEKNRYFHFEKEENKDIKSFFAICPYGKTDDILWVRESFCGIYQKDNSIKFHYKADASLVFDKALKIFWKPSIHMPKIAARIFLKITDVRVERLQDISENDINNEGIIIPINNGKIKFLLGVENSALSFLPKKDISIIDDYSSKEVMYAFWAELWCKINGRKSWNLNPWVWVIKFELIEKPQNFI